MGNKSWEVVYDEHGIDGIGEYCGDNDGHPGCINMFYHEALGGKYVPRAVLFDLEPGVIGAVTLSRRSASSSARVTSWTIRAGKNWAKGHYKRAENRLL
jgi:tubulin beta